MNQNTNSNNNINDMDRNKSMKWNGIDFTGPYTVIHHHYFQMVDALTHHCRRTLCGLNPYALPYVPQYQVDMNEMDGKMKENNMKSPLYKER